MGGRLAGSGARRAGACARAHDLATTRTTSPSPARPLHHPTIPTTTTSTTTQPHSLPSQEPKDRWEVPRVSPTRLAAHLASAFTIYGLLVYTCLQVAFPGPPPAVAGGAAAGALRALRVRAHPVAGLIALTAASGADRGRKERGGVGAVGGRARRRVGGRGQRW